MTHTYAAYKRPTSEQKKNLHRLKVKGWKQIFQANGQEIKAGVAILISHKIDFKKGAIKRASRSLFNTQRKNPPRRHKHCKYICMQHRSTQIRKENLGGLQKDINSNTIIVGDFNTPQ